MPGLEISIITAKFKTKAEEPQISRFFSKLLDHVFGVKPLDGEQWRIVLEQALRSAENAWSHIVDEAWSKLWGELRNAPQTVSTGFLSASVARVRVRNGHGKWVLPSQVLRPGPIVTDHPNIASVLLDQKYHGNDEHLLGALNILSEPRNELTPWNGAIGDAYQRYEQTVRSRYTSILAAKSKYPQWHLFDFIGSAKVLAGTPDAIVKFRAEGNVTFSQSSSGCKERRHRTRFAV